MRRGDEGDETESPSLSLFLALYFACQAALALLLFQVGGDASSEALDDDDDNDEDKDPSTIQLSSFLPWGVLGCAVSSAPVL